MPVGQSNRVVIDTDVDLKKELYAVLKAEEKSLKYWFEEHARAYISERAQPSLFSQDEFKEEIK
tara:strand:+ start:435 stop:626 length:192 start_codon:yes stop_codon:yes gene_type:complete